MNRFNEEYYIAVEPKGDNQPYVIADKKTAARGYHYTKLPEGKPPLFFFNRNKEKDLASGNKWAITPVLETGGDFLVSDYIANELMMYEIDGLQLYPAVYIDDDDNWHEEYWFLTFFEKFRYWDSKNSEFMKIDSSDSEFDAEIDKYCLDESKLSLIPEEQRLIFKMGGVGDPYVFFHKKMVDLFTSTKSKGIRFFKVSEFEEGDQFKRLTNSIQP